MKKQLIQVGLTVSSLLIFGIAANAQTQYRADIPFDFQAAGKVWSAGAYSLGQISSGGPALVIRDRKTGKSKVLGQSMPRNESRDSHGQLVFLKADGVYTLSQIVTPSFEMKLKKTTTDVRMASSSAVKKETVAVSLH
jgi:hypothetical protein